MSEARSWLVRVGLVLEVAAGLVRLELVRPAWSGSGWCGSSWCAPRPAVRLSAGLVRVWLVLVRLELVRVWLVLVRLELVRVEPMRIELVRVGLVRLELVRSRPAWCSRLSGRGRKTTIVVDYLTMANDYRRCVRVRDLEPRTRIGRLFECGSSWCGSSWSGSGLVLVLVLEILRTACDRV